MDFAATLKAACSACAQACQAALIVSREDAVNARVGMGATMTEPLADAVPKRSGIMAFLFGTPALQSTEIQSRSQASLPYDTDVRSAKALVDKWHGLIKHIDKVVIAPNLPVSMSRSAHALGTKASFILQHGMDTQQRRRSGLVELEQMLETAEAMLEAASAWIAPPAADHNPDKSPYPGPRRGYKGAVGTARKQIAMDFSGAGRHDTVTRVWLPVPSARTREMISMGARYDPEASPIGSRLWIPLEESDPFDAVLPLAFRREPTRFSYPPIRHGAVGQNLGKVFDRESWNRLRKDAYARSGHRCQICGRQESTMWSRIATDKERATPGLVDCHEVWEWDIPDLSRAVGIQRLRRLLVLCKDCHMSFHDGFALSRAKAAGIEDVVRIHIDKIRMLTNRLPLEAVQASAAADREAWQANRGVSSWVLDLSRIAAQDIMADHTLVLDPLSAAGTVPDLVGGTEFLYKGLRYAAVPAEELAAGQHARLATVSGERRI